MEGLSGRIASLHVSRLIEADDIDAKLGLARVGCRDALLKIVLLPSLNQFVQRADVVLAAVHVQQSFVR